MSNSPFIVYVETNFLMSIATGRDPEASDLLSDIALPDRIALPQICIMEAMSVLNAMRRSRNQFGNQLAQQIAEMGRDNTSAHARELFSLLNQAKIESNRLLEDINSRLFGTVGLLAHKAELIGLTGEILVAQLNTILLDDPTDNLILHCILAHAREHSSYEKVFLTGDREAFGGLSIQGELGNVGITKSFWKGLQFQMWSSFRRQS
ncbi:MAG: PIN domain-containing protein [Isosphaeraceae bacterium]